MSAETYNLCSIFLQVIVAIGVFLTAWIYHRQLDAMLRNTQTQGILSLVSYLQNPELRKDRTIVRRDLRGKKYSDWTNEEKRAADSVCSSYDVASVLILQQGLVPAQAFLSNWGPSIRDCYEILRPRIEELQKPEHSGPAYWDDFAKLYDAATQ